MANNNTDPNPENTEPGNPQLSMEELQTQLEALKAERDKAVAESRKWEGRSKSNAEKAKKYDELAAKSMTADERAEAAIKRANEAETKLAEFEAQAQRTKDAAEVSEKYSVPASLITETEREAMETQAKSILMFAKGQQTAQVFKADGKQPGQAKQSPVGGLADWLRKIDK